MIRGIVVTHGKLGEGLVQTAALICGPVDECFALSNHHKSPDQLTKEINTLLSDGKPTMLFVDFFAGSCGFVCLRVEKDNPEVNILSGVNLAMLIAFINYRDRMDEEELIAAILKESRDSLRIVSSGDFDAA